LVLYGLRLTFANFKTQLHTMLCLITKGVHLEEPTRKSAEPDSAHVHAYENFATQLNLSLHGKSYSKDIPKEEIIAMLDHLLGDRKHVVGTDKLSLHMRSPHGRVTRGMVLAFGRVVGSDFYGSKEEWKAGRGRKVMKVQKKIEREIAEKRAEKRRFWRR
jgi:hypothetical protein